MSEFVQQGMADFLFGLGSGKPQLEVGKAVDPDFVGKHPPIIGSSFQERHSDIFTQHRLLGIPISVLGGR